MRIEAAVASMSWIPSESITGSLRQGFEHGLAHYDAPPPDRLDGLGTLEELRDADAFRFANHLRAWIEVRDDGTTRTVTTAGLGNDAGLLMGATTVRVGTVGATFRAHSMPTLRPDAEVHPDRVRFVQTVGGRTGVPLPRPVPHPPFVQWAAPLVWTTLALTLHVDGRAEVELLGASAFPRHWVYGPDGALVLKSGLTEQSTWVAHSFGRRTPWGDQDSPALVTAAESELERQMSREIMGGVSPEVRRLPAGSVVTRQGDPGNELFLLLDGVLAVEVDGRRLAEIGPGAVVGERAVLEGGLRTSTLVAVTPVRLAVAAAQVIDLDRLRELATGHHREDANP